jgi:hypothetical protein
MEREWICRVADKPRTASRTRERETRGERKISSCSPVAAYTDCKYIDASNEIAVTCEVVLPVVSAAR